MKIAGTAILLAGTLAATLPLCAVVAEPWVPPGKRLEFTITRDGDEIGRQTLTFAREGGRLVVDTRVEIRVKRFFVTVHRFERSARSVWQDGLVQSYAATTDNNGEESRLSVTARADGLAIAGTAGSRIVDRKLKISEFWNVDVLAEKSVINTVTGAVDTIAVGPPEKTALKLGGRTIPALRYRVTGKATRDFWYDEKGGLLQISRKARDGSTILTRRR